MRTIAISLCIIAMTAGGTPAAGQGGMSGDAQPVAPSVRQFGQRESRTSIAAKASPMTRIANRVQSRVQNRVQSRIDRNSYLQGDTTTAIGAASNQARTAGQEPSTGEY